MIAIEITDKGYLDIPEKLTLQLELLNPLYNGNAFDSGYTYPIELPNTPNNLRLTRFPNQLDSTISGREPLPCSVFSEGVKIIEGSITITSVNSKKIIAFILKNGVEIKKAEEKLKSIDFGGDRVVANPPATYMKDHAHAASLGDVDSGWDYVFFPVHNPSFYDGKTDFGLGPHHNYSGYMNLWDFNYQKFWSNTNIFQIVNNGNGEYQNPDNPPAPSNFVPFPYLIYVLRRVAAHLGLTLSGDWIRDPGVKRLTMFNTYALDKSFLYSTGMVNVYHNEATTINIANHLPDITIAEFINALGKGFKLRVSIDSKTKRLILNTYSAIASNELDFTGRIANDFSIDIKESSEGYTLKLQPDDSDTISEEFSKKTISEETLSPDEFSVFPASDPIGTIRFMAINYYDNQKGSFFFPAPISPAANLQIGKGKEEIALGLGTLHTDKYKTIEYSDPNDSTNNPPPIITYSAGIVPVCNQIGNSELHGMGVSNPFTFRLLFYAGYQPTQNGTDAPMGTSNIYDINGSQILDSSLKWLGGDYSLYHRYWKDYLNDKEGKTVTFSLRLGINELEDMDIYSKIRIINRMYLIQTISLAITHQGVTAAKIKCLQLPIK